MKFYRHLYEEFRIENISEKNGKIIIKNGPKYCQQRSTKNINYNNYTISQWPKYIESDLFLHFRESRCQQVEIATVNLTISFAIIRLTLQKALYLR